MKRTLALLMPFAVLAAAVPWWWGGEDDGARLLGMPVWAVFGIAGSAAFATTVACLIARFWEAAAGDEPEAGPRP